VTEVLDEVLLLPEANVDRSSNGRPRGDCVVRSMARGGRGSFASELERGGSAGGAGRPARGKDVRFKGAGGSTGSMG
jgi:hypothetical protein